MQKMLCDLRLSAAHVLCHWRVESVNSKQDCRQISPLCRSTDRIRFRRMILWRQLSSHHQATTLCSLRLQAKRSTLMEESKLLMKNASALGSSKSQGSCALSENA